MERPLTVRTTCPYCGVGCGVIAEQAGDGTVSVRGDPQHPANFGRLCSKGAALAETLDLDGRLLEPVVHGRAATWDRALAEVARGFSRTIKEHGPDAVAFYASGQLLTEDYYVANKLMKGYIGSANIDTNSRLCMASSVAGHRRAFGSDTVPGCYEDLEAADLVVLAGSNLAWCHPVLYQRLAAAKEARPDMRVVVIDPRRTLTADIADHYLPICADGDVALFNGLLAYLARHGVVDQNFVAAHTAGFAGALEAAAESDLSDIASETGLEAAMLERFYALFAATERTVTIYSQGVNQSTSGTDKVSAIINCHLATGRIGRPGMGPFSVTGQPNAMGGREVGGLANMLAAHMEIENETHRERVQRFWGSPTIAARPGLKAVDMFRAVGDGRIKAIWIMATNPAASLPMAAEVEAALAACPFVVVSDVVGATDTLRHAHVRLPALAWGEKNGTVTNSERCISRQRAFLAAPGAARADWWIIAEVAKRMGFASAFSYAGPADIFAEHAALSAFENDGARDFDIGGVAGFGAADYDAMQPFQWPRPARSQASSARFFGDGRFYTSDRRARFVAVAEARDERTSPAFPLVLNTGRVRDHWHTLTRTGKSPRLSAHLAEPYAEINPRDGARLGIGDADLVRVASTEGSILVRALISERQAEGTVFVPMHWTDQFASRARVGELVPALTDPTSGQPASKHVAVRIERFAAAVYGFAVLARKPAHLDAEYWALARCSGGWRVELAFAADQQDWPAFALSLFGAGAGAETIAYHDLEGGQHCFACFEESRLQGALYLAKRPVSASRSWLAERLVLAHETRRERLAVVAGRPGGGGADRGATVCSCFGVGANEIAAAVREGCATVEAVGQKTQAGTNCGSCRLEIRGLIAAHRLVAAE